MAERVTLGPVVQSVGKARHFVRSVLEESGCEEWVESAEIAVSEVVTNAVLHAHTPVDLSVEVGEESVRVEVRDYSLVLPSPRSYDEEATTGRGMLMVSALCSEYGVETHDDGKSVWFCVGGDEGGGANPLDAWDVWEVADLGPRAPSKVVLRGMSAVLWMVAQQQRDALLREFILYRQTHPSEHAGLDVAGASTAQSLLARATEKALSHPAVKEQTRRRLPENHPSPLPDAPEVLDVELLLTREEAGHFSALQDVLDAALRLAMQGEFLMRPGLPETIALRDWACDQVVAQIQGVEATPWRGIDLEAVDRFLAPAPEWDDTPVSSAPTPILAVDDANRLIGVSPSAAELLGWEAKELVGQRVVVIVPHRLRELHVAGFTRHLTTGEAHVLGVDLDLPVLRKDGSELVCGFRIEQAPAGARAVYVAYLSSKE